MVYQRLVKKTVNRLLAVACLLDKSACFAQQPQDVALLKLQVWPLEGANSLGHGCPYAIANRNPIAFAPSQRHEHGGCTAPIAGKVALELFIEFGHFPRQRLCGVIGNQRWQPVERDRGSATQQRRRRDAGKQELAVCSLSNQPGSGFGHHCRPWVVTEPALCVGVNVVPALLVVVQFKDGGGAQLRNQVARALGLGCSACGHQQLPARRYQWMDDAKNDGRGF